MRVARRLGGLWALMFVSLASCSTEAGLGLSGSLDAASEDTAADADATGPDAPDAGGAPAEDVPAWAQAWCEANPPPPTEEHEPPEPPFPIPERERGPEDPEPFDPAPTPGFRLDPPDLGFGPVAPGSTAAVSVELEARTTPSRYQISTPPPCPSASSSFCVRVSSPPITPAGERFQFEVVYQPSDVDGPGGPAVRDTAALVVTRDDEIALDIRIDGEPLIGPAVGCWAPTPLTPTPVGSCVDVPVWCTPRGPAGGLLTRLDLGTEVRVDGREGPTGPTPSSPLTLGPAGATWRYSLCPEGSGPFEAQLVWQSAPPDGQPASPVQTLAIRGEAQGPDLQVPDALALPFELPVARASLAIRNAGIGPAVLEAASVRGPFTLDLAASALPMSLPGRATTLLTVEFRAENLVPGARPSGTLELVTRDEVYVVGLEVDPDFGQDCTIEVPDSLSLGRVASPRDGSAFTVAAHNPGAQVCAWRVEGRGAVVGVHPMTDGLAGSGSPTPEASIVIPPRSAANLVVVPLAGLGTGPWTGDLLFFRAGEEAPAAQTEVALEVVPDATRVEARLLTNWWNACDDSPLGLPYPEYEVSLSGPTVQAVTLEDSGANAFTVTVMDELPAPSVRVRVAPEPGMRPRGTVLLHADTARGRATTPLAFGDSTLRRDQTDQYQVPGPVAVDVLMVIDDSPSMSRWHEELASNLWSFLSFMDAQYGDYRLLLARPGEDGLVPLTADGRTWIERSDDAVTRGSFLASALGPPEAPAFGGPGREATVDGALRAAWTAQAQALRPEAVLRVVVVTDEPDQSPSDVEALLEGFLRIKGFRNTQLFSLSVVAGGFFALRGGVDGCRSPTGSVPPTPRLQEIAERTGGAAASLCFSDWSRSLEDLPRTGGWWAPGRFFVVNQPVPSSIRVEVNGERVPPTCGERPVWAYDWATNSVNFAPLHTPGPGSGVRIAYTACTAP